VVKACKSLHPGSIPGEASIHFPSVAMYYALFPLIFRCFPQDTAEHSLLIVSVSAVNTAEERDCR